MLLSEINYALCECGRNYPLAEYVKTKAGELTPQIKAHDRTECKACTARKKEEAEKAYALR